MAACTKGPSSNIDRRPLLKGGTETALAAYGDMPAILRPISGNDQLNHAIDHDTGEGGFPLMQTAVPSLIRPRFHI